MECPKCKSKKVKEYSLIVAMYTLDYEDGEEVIESVEPDEVLLPLSYYCAKCNYQGYASDFGLDKRSLINPVQDEKDPYIQYLLQEAKVRVYPEDELLEQLKKVLQPHP